MRERLGKIETPTGNSKKLSENVWLLERKNSARLLAQIVSEAENSGLHYDVRYLSSDCWLWLNAVSGVSPGAALLFYRISDVRPFNVV